ncbi:MAG TPA: hypothetical protein VL403_19560 [Candidatus Kryptonia bacterium]|nr:hypothetical protein [Candidatus Kryptonia bacterium]
MRRALLLLTLASVLPACGRKAPIKAPELAAPRTIEDLRAANAVDGVMLTWSRPRQYVDGTNLTDLGRFVVERATESGAAGFETISILEVNDRERFRQTRSFRYLDKTPALGSNYLYRVIASTVDGYDSAPSNTATIRREVPVEPTRTPTANARENSPAKTP